MTNRGLQDIKKQSEGALRAAHAYASIVRAIEESRIAAQEALWTARNATQKVIETVMNCKMVNCNHSTSCS